MKLSEPRLNTAWIDWKVRTYIHRGMYVPTELETCVEVLYVVLNNTRRAIAPTLRRQLCNQLCAQLLNHNPTDAAPIFGQIANRG